MESKEKKLISGRKGEDLFFVLLNRQVILGKTRKLLEEAEIFGKYTPLLPLGVMEKNKVMPDEEYGDMIVNTFGKLSSPFKKYCRQNIIGSRAT